MRALILAAGRGSRMGGLTEEMPKCMTSLAGKRLIDWQMMSLRKAGIGKIGIVRGYKAEILAFSEVHTFENPRWSETNMVMSLMQAASWMREESCIVSYSDIVYPPGVVTKLMDADAPISITYDVNWLALWRERFDDPLTDAETFKLDSRGHLKEIGNRPKSLAEVEGQYMGLLRFTPSGWHSVEQFVNGLPSAVRDRLDMTSLLRRLIEAGVPVLGIAIDEPWYEVDTESDLRLYEKRIASNGGMPW